MLKSPLAIGMLIYKQLLKLVHCIFAPFIGLDHYLHMIYIFEVSWQFLQVIWQCHASTPPLLCEWVVEVVYFQIVCPAVSLYIDKTIVWHDVSV